VKGILREAEEVGVDLVGAGNLGQVEVGFPVDRRLGRGPSKTGRAGNQARPEGETQRKDERAGLSQILSFSLLSLYGQVAAALPEDEVIDLANSACTFAP